MRPVVLAMNNPISRDPSMALYPAPVNCTGWRLWRMYHVSRCAEAQTQLPDAQTKREYSCGLDRRNLLETATWFNRLARQRGVDVLRELRGREVLVLGRATWQALLWAERQHLSARVLRPPWLERHVLRLWPLEEVKDVSLTLAPHPSGLCHEYNDPSMRKAVGDLLFGMIRDSSQHKENDDGTSGHSSEHEAADGGRPDALGSPGLPGADA